MPVDFGMETLTRKEVLETLNASQAYSSQLELLLKSVNEAEEQVINSSATAREKIEQTFDNVKNIFVKCLETRKTCLLSSVQTHEKEALKPLRLCHDKIMTMLNNNKITTECAQEILGSGGCKSEEVGTDFMRRATKLGALPDVPDLDNVANIAFEADNIPKLEVEALICNMGKVYSIAPVQIVSIFPKPGALHITWDDVFSEGQTCASVSQTYRLQAAFCDVNVVGPSGLNSFRDVYVGSDYEYFLRNVKCGEICSFRICCQFFGGWSTWSGIKTAKTEEEHFSWDSKNSDFILSDNNRLATALNCGSLLFSSGNQIAADTSIQFTYLSTIDPLPEDGVGLYISNEPQISRLRKQGEIFVSFHGDVYVDGRKKIISLPKIMKNGQIVFDCQRLERKWRIHIESGGKAVIYEWDIQVLLLHFAASLTQPEMQVLVE